MSLFQTDEMNSVNQIINRLYRLIMRRLETPAKSYRQRIYNNLDNLYKHIRKGDVVLVEGRTQMSRMIKLFSQSHWSHNAMYVGDELVKKGHPLREIYLKKFGPDANHLVIEAFAGKGVVASPLRKYIDHNIRITRPLGIGTVDLRVVIERVISKLGKQYDSKNIIYIALLLLPSWLIPFKKRRASECIGNCNDYQVICSGMVAEAFHSVGYPIVPDLNPVTNGKLSKKNPYGAALVMRHYSQVLPRDFDLSPNFDIIKFNIIAEKNFNYKSLLWNDEPVN